ncbi:MAG: hypothetical protein DMF90_22240 [Acidobacteria bacterium]|nr:MAG: hypothetical protein DMF90_22240 [Acidobacteriota bacterium]
MAGLRADEVPPLAVKWAFGFPGVGQMYAQPTVVGGRVFVGSAARKVYSLDARTGCQYWATDTEFPVRTAISVGSIGNRMALYFADQHALAYALDASTGELVWKTRVEDHMAAMTTGAPTLAGGKLYVPTSGKATRFRKSRSQDDRTSRVRHGGAHRAPRFGRPPRSI